MQITLIHLINIKSHQELTLHCLPGVNILYGKNGSGKTTVFEAIGFALFGAEPSSLTNSEQHPLLRSGEKEGIIAITLFSNESKSSFRITRRIVDNQADWKLYEKSGEQFLPLDLPPEKIKKKLSELLQLNKSIPLERLFCTVIGPSQELFINAFKESKKKEDRQKLFDHIFGISDWCSLVPKVTQAQKELTKRLKKIEKDTLSDLKKEEFAVERAQLEKKKSLLSLINNDMIEEFLKQLRKQIIAGINFHANRTYQLISKGDEELFLGESFKFGIRMFQNKKLIERWENHLSSGEYLQAIIALRLSLVQAMGSPFAFFDEPAVHLDRESKEKLAQALRLFHMNKGKEGFEWYDQIFLISHDKVFFNTTEQVHILE